MGVDVEAHITVVMCLRQGGGKWQKSREFHVSSCSGDSCECLWKLDYRPLGYVARGDAFVSGPESKPSDIWPRQQRERPAVSISRPQKFRRSPRLRRTGLIARRIAALPMCLIFDGLHKHILPIFGSHRLDRITVAAIEKFRNRLRDQTASTRIKPYK